MKKRETTNLPINDPKQPYQPSWLPSPEPPPPGSWGSQAKQWNPPEFMCEVPQKKSYWVCYRRLYSVLEIYDNPYNKNSNDKMIILRTEDSEYHSLKIAFLREFGCRPVGIYNSIDMAFFENAKFDYYNNRTGIGFIKSHSILLRSRMPSITAIDRIHRMLNDLPEEINLFSLWGVYIDNKHSVNITFIFKNNDANSLACSILIKNKIENGLAEGCFRFLIGNFASGNNFYDVMNGNKIIEDIEN